MSRNGRGVTEISQFPFVTFFLLLFILVPVLDLGIIFLAAATQYLATNEVVAKAATQATYSDALKAMVDEANDFQNNRISSFARLQPQGGHTGCGCDMFVLGTNVVTGNTTTSLANRPLGQAIDTKNNIYELNVHSLFSVSPLVSISALPFVGRIPGLGAPAVLSFNAHRPIEHPGGFQSERGDDDYRGQAGVVSKFPRLTYSAPNGVRGMSSSPLWRNPDIYAQIKDAGKKVVSVNVVVVPADWGPVSNWNGGGWINSGLSIQSGQNIWVDTRASGTWGFCPVGYRSVLFDADGDANSITTGVDHGDGRIDSDFASYMLIGYLGIPPIMPHGHNGTQISKQPSCIGMGDFCMNGQLASTGPLWIGCNDNGGEDGGFQYVRLIITQ